MTYDILENGCLVAAYGTDETVIIPDNVKTIGIGIEPGVFKDREAKQKIKKIIIPEGVQHISANAFRGMQGLEEVLLPSTLEAIDAYAFYKCTSLKNIHLPDSLVHLGASTFNGCSALTQIEIPGSISMKDSQFAYDSIFCDCSELKEVVVHHGIDRLPNKAFSGCSNLQRVSLPDTLEGIGGFCFERCKNLSEIDLPKNLSWVGSHSFAGCESLKRVCIPQGVTELYEYVFFLCSSLESIVLPDKLSIIGNCALSGCSNLQAIDIPKPVCKIEYGAFDGCKKLKSIIWPASANRINGATFRDCSSLQEIILPEGLKSIDGGAFENCTELKNVAIPDSVTKIHKKAFLNAGVAVAPKENVSTKLTKEQEAEALILDSDGTKTYTIGTEVYKARLDSKLALVITEEATGKTCKSLPAGMCAKQFALLKKNYKIRVSEELKKHLSMFISGKTIKNWAVDYCSDPVLGILSRVLVWKCAKGCFISLDGQYVDWQGNPVEISGGVALAHPAEMTSEECKGWREFLKAHKIVQPFVQMGEKLADLSTLTIQRYFKPIIERYEFEKFAPLGLEVKYSTEKKSRSNLYFDLGGNEIYSKIPPIKEVWIECEGITIKGAFENHSFAFAPNDIDVWYANKIEIPTTAKKRTINHMFAVLDSMWTLNK